MTNGNGRHEFRSSSIHLRCRSIGPAIHSNALYIAMDTIRLFSNHYTLIAIFEFKKERTMISHSFFFFFYKLEGENEDVWAIFVTCGTQEQASRGELRRRSVSAAMIYFLPLMDDEKEKIESLVVHICPCCSFLSALQSTSAKLPVSFSNQ